MREDYTLSPPDGQYWNQIDYITCSWRLINSIQWAKTRLGAECYSDHGLLIAKLRLKLEKVGKSTRPFRHDLNQSPYDYTVEVTNRFKGLDLVDRMPEELLYRRQWSRPPPRKRSENGKMVVWGGLTNSLEKKRSERQRKKGRIYPFQSKVPKNNKER